MLHLEFEPAVGATDELGSRATDNPLSVKRLHATVLQQLGLDPNRLAYFYRGLDQKLVGVEPIEPIHEVTKRCQEGSVENCRC